MSMTPNNELPIPLMKFLKQCQKATRQNAHLDEPEAADGALLDTSTRLQVRLSISALNTGENNIIDILVYDHIEKLLARSILLPDCTVGQGNWTESPTNTCIAREDGSFGRIKRPFLFFSSDNHNEYGYAENYLHHPEIEDDTTPELPFDAVLIHFPNMPFDQIEINPDLKEKVIAIDVRNSGTRRGTGTIIAVDYDVATTIISQNKLEVDEAQTAAAEEAALAIIAALTTAMAAAAAAKAEPEAPATTAAAPAEAAAEADAGGGAAEAEPEATAAAAPPSAAAAAPLTPIAAATTAVAAAAPSERHH